MKLAIREFKIRGYEKRMQHRPGATDEENMANRRRRIAYAHHTMQFGALGFIDNLDAESCEPPPMPKKGYWTASLGGDWPPELGAGGNDSADRELRHELLNELRHEQRERIRSQKEDEGVRRVALEERHRRDWDIGRKKREAILNELVESSTETFFKQMPASPSSMTLVLLPHRDHHMAVTVQNLSFGPILLFSGSCCVKIAGRGQESFSLKPGESLFAAPCADSLDLCICKGVSFAYYSTYRSPTR